MIIGTVGAIIPWLLDIFWSTEVKRNPYLLARLLAIERGRERISCLCMENNKNIMGSRAFMFYYYSTNR